VAARVVGTTGLLVAGGRQRMAAGGQAVVQARRQRRRGARRQQAQRPQHRALRRVQQAPAAVDDGAHRSVPRVNAAAPATARQQVERTTAVGCTRLLQRRRQRLRPQRAHLGGGQFEGQRQAIEPAHQGHQRCLPWGVDVEV
jgi:hypothetical protein